MASGRGIAVCLAVLGVLGLGLLPAEHAHSRTEHGHHTELVHRHFEPHHPIEAGVRAHDEAGLRVDDEDDHDGEAQFLTNEFTAPKTSDSVRPIDAALLDGVPLVAAERPARWTPRTPDASGHDPPETGPPGLRAPPNPLV